MSEKKQTVLLAGATGYTGQRLLPLLNDQKVIAWLRADSPNIAAKCRALTSAGATPLATDLTVTPALIAKVKGADCIVSLLGTTKAQFDAKTSYESVDFGLNDALIKLALASGIPRFILLSSIGTEKPMGAYLTIKRKTEDLLIASGLDYIILRPSFITGPGRRAAEILTPFFKLAGLAYPKWADNYRGLSADLLARILKNIIADRSLKNQILAGTDLWSLTQNPQK